MGQHGMPSLIQGPCQQGKHPGLGGILEADGGEPFPGGAHQALRYLQLPQLVHQAFFVEQIVLHDGDQSLGHLLPVPRQQCRMRNGNAQGMAEQGRHRKPVGQAAYQPRLKSPCQQPGSGIFLEGEHSHKAGSHHKQGYAGNPACFGFHYRLSTFSG
ncbi:hypothetical protein D3C75_829960 [compost metagenome]